MPSKPIQLDKTRIYKLLEVLGDASMLIEPSEHPELNHDLKLQITVLRELQTYPKGTLLELI